MALVQLGSGLARRRQPGGTIPQPPPAVMSTSGQVLSACSSSSSSASVLGVRNMEPSASPACAAQRRKGERASPASARGCATTQLPPR